jgi:HEAT repeat protein
MRLAILMCVLAFASSCPAEDGTPADTLSLRAMTPEELFVRASSAELQYADVLEPARRLLVERHAESVPYLITKLDTDEPRERIALENLFQRIGGNAVPELVDALAAESRRDDTTRGARLAAYVLARIGDRAAIPPLVEQARHDDWKLRSSIADALGHLGDAESVDTLVELLGDADSSVRKAAAASLDRIARDAPPLVLEAGRDALSLALDDEFYGVRFAASDALGRLGDEIVSDVSDLALSGTPRVRLMALRTLGLIGGRDALRGIARHLEDDDWAVRAHAAEAAGNVGVTSRSVRKKLQEMATGDEHPLVASKARASLEAWDDR